MQTTGDASRLREIAALNQLNITDDLVVDSEIMVPEPDISYKTKVKVFNDVANLPASASNLGDNPIVEGVGYWTIGIDFEVTNG